MMPQTAVDGVYVSEMPKTAKAGLEKEKAALLVVIGGLSDGRKVVLSVVPGHRESAESWVGDAADGTGVLRDLLDRGMGSPKLVIGDGHLGIWGALRNVYCRFGIIRPEAVPLRGTVLEPQDTQRLGQAPPQASPDAVGSCCSARFPTRRPRRRLNACGHTSSTGAVSVAIGMPLLLPSAVPSSASRSGTSPTWSGTGIGWWPSTAVCGAVFGAVFGIPKRDITDGSPGSTGRTSGPPTRWSHPLPLPSAASPT